MTIATNMAILTGTGFMKIIITMVGNVLTINTGSISTKIAFFVDGKLAFEQKIQHSPEELKKLGDIMNQNPMRREAVLDFLRERGIQEEDVDIVMARGGLITPVITGIYDVNDDMEEILRSGRDGMHACNLSAIIAREIADEVNRVCKAKGVKGRFGECKAYIADPPRADEMLPECQIFGLPEFPREVLFHALNSRAVVRRYLKEIGHEKNDITAIVCHIGGGVTISTHRNGRVIDTSHGLGGDGPITPERAGCCPAYLLIDLCYSGKYTKEEMKHKIIREGGAMAYLGTNDMRLVVEKAQEGLENYKLFLDAFCLNIAKYILSQAATVYGKVDIIILTGGVSYNKVITDDITARVNYLAPVIVYPGEDEMQALAENGYMVLGGGVKIHTYNKDRLLED